jgi:hypothetical protein
LPCLLLIISAANWVREEPFRLVAKRLFVATTDIAFRQPTPRSLFC